jgi:hypothetical protein
MRNDQAEKGAAHHQLAHHAGLARQDSVAARSCAGSAR